jgi:hypothetical protein
MVFALAAAATPATAADCGCRDAVRAALAREDPVAPRAPAMKPPARKPRMAARAAPVNCNCGPRSAAAQAEGGYDYRAARAIDTNPYRWRTAPEGYVSGAMAANVPAYDGPADLPPYAPMSYALPDDGPAYPEAAGPVITVDQQGWIGGVGYAREGGGGGGGGGGGMTLTLAQPDSQNGPSYNSFGQSYGGDYQSANQVGAWRTQAFTPPANSGSGSK